MINIFLIVIGLLFLVKSADFLVDGASSLAKKWGISDLIIGLTVVALGTSTPELFTSIFATIKGEADIAVGNVIGSNISNLLLILGVTAIVYPIRAKLPTQLVEIPYSLIVTLALFFLSFDTFFSSQSENIISFGDGCILLLLFVLFLKYSIYLANIGIMGTKSHIKNQRGVFVSVFFILIGIVGLGFGANLLIKGATDMALRFGISESFIGLTIIAIGTSLPELFTSVVAAYKRNSDIAIGNVVGSNILNITLILGVTGLFSPLSVKASFLYDYGFLIFITVLFIILLVGVGKRGQIGRGEGILFLALYICYTVYLISTQVV